MAKKKIVVDKCDCSCGYGIHKHAGSGGVYCLGFIGAAIYYISNSTGFWMGVLGILKAAIWPAFLVFKLLGL